MRWLIVFAAFVVLISSAPMTAAQQATPSAADELLKGSALGIARRDFTRTGTHLVGTTYFSFFVLEFDTEAHAEAAGPAMVEHLVDDPKLGLKNLKRTSTRTFRDGALAYTGKAEFDGPPADAAILIVRDGRVLHFWIAGGPNADPLTDLYAVADAKFVNESGEESMAPNIDINALLPTLDDLPPGFVLEREDLAG